MRFVGDVLPYHGWFNSDNEEAWAMLVSATAVDFFHSQYRTALSTRYLLRFSDAGLLDDEIVHHAERIASKFQAQEQENENDWHNVVRNQLFDYFGYYDRFSHRYSPRISYSLAYLSVKKTNGHSTHGRRLDIVNN